MRSGDNVGVASMILWTADRALFQISPNLVGRGIEKGARRQTECHRDPPSGAYCTDIIRLVSV